MLKVEQLNLFYGASQALHQVSLEARPGEVTCILGRNGVGKTSLLKALAGHHPAQGKIIWEDREITRLKPDERARRGMAYVPQGRDIFGQLTVAENLQIGFSVLPRSQRRIPAEIYDLFPVLKQMLRRRGGDLSGGQQQQLAIARALVTRPRVLMLDEPTEGIQPSIIKDIQSVIALLRDRGEMAIVLVEQYFDFARKLADRFLVLDRGHVVMAGDGKTMDANEVQKHLTV